MRSCMPASCPAAARGRTLSPPTNGSPGARIAPADLLTVELITRADRRRLQRSAAESASAVLLADDALARMTLHLRHCPRIDVLTRSLIAEHVRTAMIAHHAALLRVTEIEAISSRMGVA